MPPQETRISVVETRLDGQEKIIENIQDTLKSTMERLDTHLVDSTKRDEKIREELANVSVAIAENNVAVSSLSHVVTEATVALKDVTNLAKENQLAVVKWDAIAKTIAKVGAIIAVVVSALWAVFTFAVDHPPRITIQQPEQGTK